MMMITNLLCRLRPWLGLDPELSPYPEPGPVSGPLPGPLVDVTVGGTTLVVENVAIVDSVEATVPADGLLGVMGGERGGSGRQGDRDSWAGWDYWTSYWDNWRWCGLGRTRRLRGGWRRSG